ncbi:hypothetical protein ACPA9J_14155 [Pseudomonas aeruginosa]
MIGNSRAAGDGGIPPLVCSEPAPHRRDSHAFCSGSSTSSVAIKPRGEVGDVIVGGAAAPSSAAILWEHESRWIARRPGPAQLRPHRTARRSGGSATPI